MPVHVPFQPLPPRPRACSPSAFTVEPALGRVPAEQRGDSNGRIASSLIVVAACGIAASAGTYAAFSDTTTNEGDTFIAGTVDIDDDDSGIALVGLTAGNPGETDTGCITVAYNGSLESNVRLYGTTTGTGFDEYVTLTVERGTWSGPAPAFDDCTGFTPDATDYVGAGAGVVYAGTLADFPDDWATGVVDGGGTPESWTPGESRSYRLTVTVADADAAQGLTANQTFTWEARNT